MAFESYYWKQGIKTDVLYLENKLKLSHSDTEINLDKHFSQVEIKLMTLAYIVRKLADTGKLPDKALLRKIHLEFHPRIESFERRSYSDIEREYDLSKTQKTSLSLRELSNQIIHSYVLQVFGTKVRTFKYLWFVSDKQRDFGLYKIEIKKLLMEFLVIANSEVTTMRSHYDNKKKDWVIERK